jgi:streptogramin lyase
MAFSSAQGSSLPSGIVRDAAGTMFVADYGSGIIRRLGTDNIVENIASGPLNGPAGIEVDTRAIYTLPMNAIT